MRIQIDLHRRITSNIFDRASPAKLQVAAVPGIYRRLSTRERIVDVLGKFRSKQLCAAFDELENEKEII